jgi:RNA polymerase sigma-70 factor (ECF subfamily)
VWRYVVHLTGDRAGADDVVQETLLRAWRTPRILAQDPATTRSWMFTVARHLVVDDVRSARRRREIVVDDVPERAQADATEALFEAILIEEALAALHYGLRALRLALQEKGVTR